MIQPGEEDENQAQEEPDQQSETASPIEFTEDLAMDETVAIPDPKKTTT